MCDLFGDNEKCDYKLREYSPERIFAPGDGHNCCEPFNGIDLSMFQKKIARITKGQWLEILKIKSNLLHGARSGNQSALKALEAFAAKIGTLKKEADLRKRQSLGLDLRPPKMEEWSNNSSGWDDMNANNEPVSCKGWGLKKSKSITSIPLRVPLNYAPMPEPTKPKLDPRKATSSSSKFANMPTNRWVTVGKNNQKKDKNKVPQQNIGNILKTIIELPNKKFVLSNKPSPDAIPTKDEKEKRITRRSSTISTVKTNVTKTPESCKICKKIDLDKEIHEMLCGCRVHFECLETWKLEDKNKEKKCPNPNHAKRFSSEKAKIPTLKRIHDVPTSPKTPSLASPFHKIPAFEFDEPLLIIDPNGFDVISNAKSEKDLGSCIYNAAIASIYEEGVFLFDFGSNLREHCAKYLLEQLKYSEYRSDLNKILPIDKTAGQIDCEAANFKIPMESYDKLKYLNIYGDKMWDYKKSKNRWLGILHYRLISGRLNRPLIVGKKFENKYQFTFYDNDEKEKGTLNLPIENKLENIWSFDELEDFIKTVKMNFPIVITIDEEGNYFGHKVTSKVRHVEIEEENKRCINEIVNWALRERYSIDERLSESETEGTESSADALDKSDRESSMTGSSISSRSRGRRPKKTRGKEGGRKPKKISSERTSDFGSEKIASSESASDKSDRESSSSMNSSSISIKSSDRRRKKPRGRQGGRKPKVVKSQKELESATPIIANSQRDLIMENINEYAADLDIDPSSIPIPEESITEEEADSLLMPPPRRSTRKRQATSRFSDEFVKKDSAWQFKPVTHQCDKTHPGFGCAAKSARHMPEYYDSTIPKASNIPSKCPYSDCDVIPSEATGPSAFSKCCAKGRVDLRAKFDALCDMPLELQCLVSLPTDHKLKKMQEELMKHPMIYNAQLAFGQTKIERAEDLHDHRIVKINNMIEYVLWSYNRPDASKQDILQGQMFTIPPQDADQRLDEIAVEKKIDPDLLKWLYNILKKHHWMANVYKIAADLYENQSDADKLRIRLNVVDTSRIGEERLVEDPNMTAIPIPIIDPQDRPFVGDIHAGRLGIETPMGNRVVAQIYLDTGDNVTPVLPKGILLTGRRGTGKIEMKWWHRCVDPASFPLIFWGGQYGFEDGMPLKLKEGEEFDEKKREITDAERIVIDPDEELGAGEEFLPEDIEKKYKRRDRISRAQYFRYMAHTRGKQTWKQENHWLWSWRDLAQLYTITSNNRIEADKVSYYKRKQAKKRWVKSKALIDWITRKLKKEKGYEGELGRLFVTDEHFRGSKQYYRKEFANALTIFNQKGKVDLMITFTMDPDAPEIAKLSLTGQKWHDRPDVVGRLFIDKLKEFVKDLTENEVMGPISAWTFSIEHQKRGLPHAHFLLALDWQRMRDSPASKIFTPEEYIAEYISAEIPDLPDPNDRSAGAKLQREYFNTIRMKNIHTCDARYCLVDGKCKKRFPKPYSNYIQCPENAYPIYLRRPPAPNEEERKKNPDAYGNAYLRTDAKGKPILNKRTGKFLYNNNTVVVPHNHYLTMKYRAHINVELVTGEGCLKYVLKYVMKGADMAFVGVRTKTGTVDKWGYDEFEQMRLARYVTAQEAFLAIWGQPLVGRSHEVDELAVHEPGEHRVPVEEGEEEETAYKYLVKAAEGEEIRSQLTAYFDYNRKHPGLDLTYDRAYERLRYDERWSTWKLYKKGYERRNKLCRLRTVSPTNLNLLAIRMLLFVVKDPKSWEDLRTYNGRVYDDFVGAAKARGLMVDLKMWEKTVFEAFSTKRSENERLNWLAIFFITARLSNPTELLEKIMKDEKKFLVPKYMQKCSIELQTEDVLQRLEWYLRAHGIRPDENTRDDGTIATACETILLPRPQNFNVTREQMIDLEFFRDDTMNKQGVPMISDPNYSDSILTIDRYKQLSATGDKPALEQQKFIDDALKAAEKVQNMQKKKEPTKKDADFQRCFFITGEGGTGKTFTLNKLIAILKSKKMKVLPMASTGIAANLLYEGQTVHKKICHAKHVDASYKVYPDAESFTAEMVRQAEVLIIDEITMQNKEVLEYVDRLIKNVVKHKELKDVDFGGKCVILGGDWKQLMPVIQGGSLLAQYNASVKNSDLFKNFTTHRLTINHRLAPGQEKYRKFIKLVGTGKNIDQFGRVQLPKGTTVTNRQDLMDFVFPQEMLDNPLRYSDELSQRAILCPLNKETLELNKLIMERMKGKEQIFVGTTSPILEKPEYEEKDQEDYEEDIKNKVFEDLENDQATVNYEYLRHFTPNGIPEHFLRIKVGAIMMLTTNVSVAHGLCNGTRVQISKISNNCVWCKFLMGPNKGQEFELPRCRMEFGGDPRSPREGTVKCERIQFPLRPGNVMTINKSQGQTLSRVGVLLENCECFSHGQLYVALSRVRDADHIRILTKMKDRRVKNIVVQQILDKEELEEADTILQEKDKSPEVEEMEIGSDIEPEFVSPVPSSGFATPSSTTSIASRLSLFGDVRRIHIQKINVISGNIAYIKSQCIVNPLNERMQMDSKVARDIQWECEPEKQNYLAEITMALSDKKLEKIEQAKNEGKDISEAKIIPSDVFSTQTFGRLSLNANNIIHVVEPSFKANVLSMEQRQILKRCYENALDEMLRLGKNSISFPCLSTENNREIRGKAASAAIEAILNWLMSHEKEDISKIFFVTNESDKKMYKEFVQAAFRQSTLDRSRSSRSSSRISSTPSMRSTSSIERQKFRPIENIPFERMEVDEETPLASPMKIDHDRTPLAHQIARVQLTTQAKAEHFPLKNRATDCFANSLIQCFRFIPEIRSRAKEFANFDFNRYMDDHDAYCRHVPLWQLGQILTKESSSVEILRETKPVKDMNLQKGQQDVMEFLTMFMDLENDLLNFSELFKYTRTTKVKCNNCQYESTTPHIEKYYSQAIENGAQDLSNLILAENEYYDVAEEWRCEYENGCGEKMGCSRTTTYDVSNTKYLAMQFLIFSLEEKIFPCISNYDEEAQQIFGAKWKIIATIVHQGQSRHAGHYFTYALENGNWYKHEDHFPPRLVNSPFVNEQDIEMDRATYVVIYKKVDETEIMEQQTQKLSLDNTKFYTRSFINGILQMFANIPEIVSSDFEQLEMKSSLYEEMNEIQKILQGKSKTTKPLKKLLKKKNLLLPKLYNPLECFTAILTLDNPLNWKKLFAFHINEIHTCEGLYTEFYNGINCGNEFAEKYEQLYYKLYPGDGEVDLGKLLQSQGNEIKEGICKNCHQISRIQQNIFISTANYLAMSLEYERSLERRIKPKFIGYDEEKQVIFGYKWRMIAALIHSPKTTQRHYYVYLKDQKNKCWWKIEDQVKPKKKATMKKDLKRVTLIFFEKIQEAMEIDEQLIETTSGIQFQIEPNICAERHYLLPSNIDSIIENFWGGRRSQFKTKTKNVSKNDLLKLRSSEWLNDEVINAYMRLIQERYEKDQTLPKIYRFETFLYNKLQEPGGPQDEA